MLNKKLVPEYIFIDIVINPTDWTMQGNVFSDTLLMRYFEIQITPRRFFGTKKTIYYKSFDTKRFEQLESLQAWKFWHVYKKWCALTRNTVIK